MGIKGTHVKQPKALDPAHWAGMMPYGLGQQHPNAYGDIFKAIGENKDNLGYAYRILTNGCCDGCSLGTTGIRDWTMTGIHLCAIRLELLRFNTMGPMDATILGDVESLKDKKEKELRELGRIPYPMIRRKGDKGFKRISWDEATKVAAEKLKDTDPHRVAWYSTSRGITNEAYYAHNKVARFFGTNNIDTSARLCHSPSSLALGATIGVGATTCSYSDWIDADLVVFVGANVPNNQPVSTKYLYYARKAGTRIFTVNPYEEPGLDKYWVPSALESAVFGTKITDEFFKVAQGGDGPFFQGVLKHVIENDWVDHDFIQKRTVGWEETEEHVRSLDWEDLERQSGLTKEDMYRFAEAFAKSKRTIIVWALGLTQHRYGTDNVKTIVNLQLSRGNVGRQGTGFMPMRGHSGVQGGAEMGLMPGDYIKGFKVTEENAKLFADHWGFTPPAWKGMGAAAYMIAAEQGEIDVLWQSGGNFLDTLPDPPQVRRALENISLRIHQDIVVNPTMLVEPRDTVLILPSTTRYEQKGGGCETSTERRVIYSPEIPGPRIPEARDEWLIPVMVARAADPEGAERSFPWKDTGDIRREIDKVCPWYHGIGELSKKGDNFQYGGPRLLVDEFLTPDKKGHFTPVPLPGEDVPEGKFLLATRRGLQFNSIITGETDPLNGAQRNDILMAKEDAERLGLKDGEAIIVTSEVAEFHGRARIARIRPGSVQGHWPEVNVLVRGGVLDPAGVPDYNAVVEIRSASASGKARKELVEAAV